MVKALQLETDVNLKECLSLTGLPQLNIRIFEEVFTQMYAVIFTYSLQKHLLTTLKQTINWTGFFILHTYIYTGCAMNGIVLEKYIKIQNILLKGRKVQIYLQDSDNCSTLLGTYIDRNI